MFCEIDGFFLIYIPSMFFLFWKNEYLFMDEIDLRFLSLKFMFERWCDFPIWFYFYEA